MIRLDPNKPGVWTMTRDQTFERESYYAFLKAGGRVNGNGYVITLVHEEDVEQRAEAK